MAASYPASIKTFSDIVDGTDFTEATQMNQAYDEIEALETMVGASGSAANQTDSILSAFREYRRGCRVIPDTVAQIKVEAGEVCCEDASGNVKLRRNTGVTTVTWGEIDDGAEDTSKRYYVHAVADAAATTFTVVISLSATAPTGVTTFKLLGSFFNDSGDDITDVMDDLWLIGKEPGTIEAWPTNYAPGGAILCDGSATVGTTVDPTLADLYSGNLGSIGIVYGGADATDFVVPDLRGRTIIGTDDMGQGSANRVTAAAADSMGGAVGSETTAHDHSVPYDGWGAEGAGSIGDLQSRAYGDNALYAQSDNTTGSDSTSVLQPSLALNYIIWK